MLPLATLGTGMVCGVALARGPVAAGALGNESMQNVRKLLTPCFVTSRIGYIPIGASGATSSFTRSLAASLPLLASVGNEILAGIPDRSVSESVKFVPVSVNSTLAPGRVPTGCGRFIVGACGDAGRIDGGGGWAMA